MSDHDELTTRINLIEKQVRFWKGLTLLLTVVTGAALGMDATRSNPYEHSYGTPNSHAIDCGELSCRSISVRDETGINRMFVGTSADRGAEIDLYGRGDGNPSVVIQAKNPQSGGGSIVCGGLEIMNKDQKGGIQLGELATATTKTAACGIVIYDKDWKAQRKCLLTMIGTHEASLSSIRMGDQWS